MLIAVPVAVALVLAWLWACAHPLAAASLAVALALIVIAVVRFCREIAPGLAVRSWSLPPARPARLCVSCGGLA